MWIISILIEKLIQRKSLIATDTILLTIIQHRLILFLKSIYDFYFAIILLPTFEYEIVELFFSK